MKKLHDQLMEMTATYIQRIDINWPECDVDMALREYKGPSMVPPYLTDMSKIKVDRSKKTPIGGSVDFAVEWLAGYVDEDEMCTTTSKSRVTELDKIGVEVIEWGTFIQGNVWIKVQHPGDYDYHTSVEVWNIIEKVFKRFVKYYKRK